MIFDFNGFLLPTEKIIIDYKYFNEYYSQLENRKKLLNSFNVIIKYLLENTEDIFYIWIGGSFVTRKEEPNDIDFTVFLTPKDYNNNLQDLIQNIYNLKDDIRLHADFKNFSPYSDYPETIVRINTIKNLFLSRKSDEITDNEITKGFIEISSETIN